MQTVADRLAAVREDEVRRGRLGMVGLVMAHTNDRAGADCRADRGPL
jgi:hypothetical protein